MDNKKQLRKQLSYYYKSINRSLIFKNRTIKKMFMEFRESVEAYVENDQTTTIESVINHFGEPKAIAEEFISLFDDSYIKKYRFVKSISIIIAVVLIAILIFLGSIATIIWTNNNKVTGTTIEESIGYYEEDME